MSIKEMLTNKRGQGGLAMGAIIGSIAVAIVGVIFLIILLGEGVLINESTFTELDNAGKNDTSDDLEDIQDDVIDKAARIISIALVVLLLGVLATLLFIFGRR